MCLDTHVHSVHVVCVTSRVFYNKNLQAKHEYFSQRVPKSTAISWFHKAKAFQHIVHNLSYAQVLAKGSNSKHMVSLDKRPYQHMIPPISNNRVKKGLNPNNKVSDRSKGVKIFVTRKWTTYKAHCFMLIIKTVFQARDQ